MISLNTRLKNKLQAIVESHPGVSDIILFGSVARGKDKPTDMDILVLFKERINKDAEYAIRKEVEKHQKNVSIVSKTEKTVLDEAFDARESIIFEGRSLLSGDKLAERHGFGSFGMFKYDFGEWSKLKKTKFYHALNGRGDKKGIADTLNCIKLADSLLLAPLEYIEGLKEFLEAWKINYVYIPTLIPIRLGRRKILE